MILEADEERKADGLQDPLFIQCVLHLFKLHNLSSKIGVKTGIRYWSVKEF